MKSDKEKINELVGLINKGVSKIENFQVLEEIYRFILEKNMELEKQESLKRLDEI